MAYILNIETSTTNCSVALSESGAVIGFKEDNSLEYSHAERLHVYIDEVLKTAKVSKDQLAAIAISKGPGSYTGLRIGVSAAKGLCYALSLPLISVPTLEALAHQVDNPKGTIVAMLDARRMEVYSAIYDANYNETRSTEAEVLTPESYQELLESTPVYFIGNGVAKTKEIITHKNAQFIEDKLPSAKQMCALSYDKFKTNDFEDVAYFEPFYLKDFIAIPSKK
jgi:tRNA threonylcarbamoyladenosine biosynthesis protein TsaB